MHSHNNKHPGIHKHIHAHKNISVRVSTFGIKPHSLKFWLWFFFPCLSFFWLLPNLYADVFTRLGCTHPPCTWRDLALIELHVGPGKQPGWSLWQTWSSTLWFNCYLHWVFTVGDTKINMLLKSIFISCWELLNIYSIICMWYSV